MKRIAAALGIFMLANVLVAAPGGPATAQKLTKLRITIPVNSLTFYPIFVAQDKGFFKAEGYEFEVIVTRGDGPDVDALISGNVQFTSTPPHRALAAYVPAATAVCSRTSSSLTMS